jgi:hypothetical protein
MKRATVEGYPVKLMIPTCADPHERRRRWSNIMNDLFELAIVSVGKSDARRIFTDAARRTGEGKYRGRGAGKHHAPNRDARMLMLYDHGRNKGVPKRYWVPIAAEFLYQEDRTAYGATVQAIERKIRRLVRERDARQQAAQARKEDDARQGHTSLTKLFGEEVTATDSSVDK